MSKYRYEEDSQKDELELVQEAKTTHKQTTGRL